ncbi:MAG: hypothetical protein ACTH1V_04420 [Alkalibacterium gilvum]|uniref:Uncharacterized protein n=1 Tax=Alkalibacterium gilvum TaxID=1130080 RepID=A0A1H6TXI6_9LACT|nr:hypothetical protein [Alkalibacterium gilvum]SEI84743.1 hypothetical protein SAMN04488113_1258 [Alkalibacterium gilvum]HAJ69930.1 hypothetical protein [Alkalibacterium sp.]
MKAPKCIINFYGYNALDYNEFQIPSAYYSNYPILTEKVVKKIIQPVPVSNGSLQTRFALYLYARQSGNWMNLLNVSEDDISQYGLNEGALNNLPPTFIAHSIYDNDVPFHIAQKLLKQIPNAYLYSVNHNDHVFDKDSQSHFSKNVYSEIFDWLPHIK